jgi:hypothetical protein
MSNEIDKELRKMEEGAAQLLGFIPPHRTPPPTPHKHEDDGHVYGETTRYYILRCSVCGEYYEEKK